MNGDKQIQIKIPARAEYISVARLLVSGVANRMGFQYDAIEDMKVAVAEACTNAVDHAYGAQSGEVAVHCEMHDDKIDFFVKDEGRGFDVRQVEAEVGPVSKEDSIEKLDEGGLGLYLIKCLMDDVKIERDGGMLVKMTKFLHGDEVGEHVNPIRENQTQ